MNDLTPRGRMGVFLIVVLAGLMFQACSSKTQVVLLPEPDGRVGKLSVTAGDQTLVLDQAYDSALAVSAKKPAKKTGVLDEAGVKQQFASALAAQPQPPVTFILNFEFGTAVLTEPSKAMLPEILAAISRREMVEINISGHTDRVGPALVNRDLAAVRARQMAQILMDNGVPQENISVESHGEGNPLIPTADEVSEPRNRRVEVVIR